MASARTALQRRADPTAGGGRASTPNVRPDSRLVATLGAPMSAEPSPVVESLDFLRPEGALLRAPDRIVPVLGAGISQGAGLAGGDRLAAEIAAAFPGRVPVPIPEDPRQVVSLVRLAPDEEVRVAEVISRLYDLDSVPWSPTRALRALVTIPSRLILTLNYDLSVETVARLEGIEHVESYGPRELGEARETLRDLRYPRLRIVHLHGRRGDPASDTVLGSLGRHHLDPAAEFLIQTLTQYRAVLLGTRADEAHFVGGMQKWPSRAPVHVFFGSKCVVEQARSTRLALEPGLGIRCVVVPDRALYDPLCEWIVRQPVAVADLQPTRGEPPHLTAFYEPLTIARLDKDHDRRFAHLDLAMGTLPIVPEEALVSLHQTVLVGGGGNGKSQVLRRLAELAPEGDYPILIPLREVRELGGSPLALLERWAAGGYSYRGADPVSNEALHTRTFHFLLDGIDEVHAALRRDLIEVLDQVAAEVPHHRFTVTSRPLEEIAEFGPAWEHLELVQDNRWAGRYLDRRGHDWDALERASPSLAALGDLVVRPLYLAAIVDLFEKGRLPRDLDPLGLLLELLEQQLDSAELGEARSFAWPWLRNVALTLLLSGRRVLSHDELDAIPFEGVAAGRSALIDRLVTRAILEEGPSGVAFADGLLAEALVADWLAGQGPRPELLDAVVPSVPQGSAVLTEWMVPLQLAMEGHPNWREAVRTRDPLAAALAVPAGADVTERRLASRTIWERYSEEERSIHDIERPRLRRAVEVMSGHIGREDLPGLQAEIVFAGTRDSRVVVRLNALTVLAEAEVDGLDTLLREVLEHDESPTVRRRAAELAADAGLASLGPAVRRLAEGEPDEQERSWVVDAALALAPDEALAELARTMIDRYPGLFDRVQAAVLPRLGAAATLSLWRYAAEQHKRPDDLLPGEIEEVLASLPPEDAPLGDVGFLLAAWQRWRPGLDRLVRDHPAPVLRGMLAAVETDRAHAVDLLPYTSHFTVELLEAEGAPAALVQARRQLDARPVASIPIEDIGGDGLGATTSERFAELLAQPPDESDNELIARRRLLAGQADRLTDAQRAELRRRLARWWPTEGLDKAIREVAPRRWEADQRVWALLELGPAADLELSPAQWAQVVAAGMAWESEVREWLRRHYQPACAGEHVARCQDRRIRIWADALAAVPGDPPDPPDALVGAALERARDGDHEDLRHLAHALLQAGRRDALMGLADRDPETGALVRPYVAELGDVPAQRELLAELAAHPQEHVRDELRWLDAVEDPDLIDELFAAVVATSRHDLERVGDFPVSSRLHSAIRRIGGPAAISGYDRLIANEPFPGARLLGRQREQLLQDALHAASQDGRLTIARGLDLPSLRADESDAKSAGSPDDVR